MSMRLCLCKLGTNSILEKTTLTDLDILFTAGNHWEIHSPLILNRVVVDGDRIT